MKAFASINTLLSKKFEELGRITAKHTSYFLLVPIFFSLWLATGLQKLNLDLSTKSLIMQGGIVDRYESRFSELFPTDISSNFEPGRFLESTFYGTIIVEAIDEGTIFRQSVFQDMIQLDDQIRNIVVKDDIEWHYEDICAKRNGNCFQNTILLLTNVIEQIKNGTVLLEYPIGKNGKDYGLISLGGVKVNENGKIISARAVKLFYFLKNKGWQIERVAKIWEKLFIERIENLKFQNIKIEKDISLAREESVMKVIRMSLYYGSISTFAMILFTFFSCSSTDFLRSKPWIGIASVIAAGMSLVSGFGLLSYIGIDILAINTVVIPFVLGVGMDDTFVMLSAWQKTDKKKLLEDRMAETLANSCLSITITSLTNILSFSVGTVITKVPAFKTFLIYGAVCFLFDYIYQITFIGAIFVLCGKAEERNLHSFVFLPMEKFTSSDEKSYLRRIFCHVKDNDITDENNENGTWLHRSLWKIFAIFMSKTVTKISVIGIYFIYLGVGIWNLNRQSIEATIDIDVINGTYRQLYLEKSKEYFNQYQYRLQIVVMQELNYADPEVQENIEEMMQDLESDSFISESILTESWLRSYLRFLSDKRIRLFLKGYNLTNPEDFIFVLRHFFLRLSLAERFRQDIAFDKTFTKIISTRFLIQTNITKNANHFYQQLVKLREKLDAAPYSVVIYHPLFFFFDFADRASEITVINLSVVGITVFLATILLLADIRCCASVIFNIVSIAGGVLGYMLFWDVRITFAAISTIIIVIGYSVDYAAHVSTAYLSSKEIDPNNRLMKAIDLTGMPILQSSISTLIAIGYGVTIPDKDISDSVKIAVLTVLIAALHGILFLPVIIFLVDSFCTTICCYKKQSYDNRFDKANP